MADPFKPHDAAWKKTALGLQFMLLGVLYTPFALPLFLFLGLVLHPWFFWGWTVPVVLYLAGLVYGMLAPDPLAKGYEAGAFLSLVGAAGLAMFWLFAAQTSLAGPMVSFAFIGLRLLIEFAVLAHLGFSFLFLVRIARVVVGRDLASDCRYLFVLVAFAAMLRLATTVCFEILDSVFFPKELFIISLVVTGVLILVMFLVYLVTLAEIMQMLDVHIAPSHSSTAP